VVHEYDGILEQDNRLPLWWLGTFYGAILFAACYWTTYEGFQTLPNPSAAYREEAAAVAAADAAKARAAGPMNEAVLEKLAADPASLDQGKSTFTTLCAACHAPTGAGTIGPNLTDAYWLHGGTGEAIYTTVRDGFAAKGMPAWGPQIGEEKVRTVAAYVRTLRNTNVAGGKAPQGDLEK
jgi:cytochrome c oxidase cbb3-type subunit 3